MTLVLSFVLFPKAFSWFYPIGAVLVLGGLLASSLLKIRDKRRNMSNSTSQSPNQQRPHLKHHESDVEAVPLLKATSR
jgi:solute carrier family 35 (adenosine 3'-phospho 5'-phosphosulfate transporter), member B3